VAVTSELISIGDELLIGQVVNTNAAALAKALNEIGVTVERTTTIGDSERGIYQAFERAWSEHDVVIVTGGLGPTHDDISKEIVSRFFNAPLEFHEDILEKVRARFERFGLKKMPESNRSQALVPKGFTSLPNDVGTAPGLYLHRDGKSFAILPGVPSEMEWLLRNSLLGLLKEAFAYKGLETIQHRTIITAGIGESLLAEKIGDANALLNGEATLAFLPRSGGVRLRISAKGEALHVENALTRIGDEIRRRIPQHVIGEGDVSAAESVVRLLIDRNETLALAESCTGGMIGAALTEVAGSSAVFLGGVISYSNDVKRSELDVPDDLLREYGAVSEQVATAMADGALKKLGSDYALSVTGIAGPGGGSEQKPVGLVFIGIAQKGHPTIARRFHFQDTRKGNREKSVAAALEMLRRRLTSQEHLYNA
jgi:nicotinamide-nucleotide amidase